MPPILLATLGQRPEAITMAVDDLYPLYQYEKVGVLHTDADISGIADSLKQLRLAWRHYNNLPLVTHTLTYPNHEPLVDISDQRSADAYYRAMVCVLKEYRAEQYDVHLLVSGGRKAMTIYATLAAGLLFGIHDKVWIVLTPPQLLQKGLFHAPAHLRSMIQMVQLPLQPSRQLAGLLNEIDCDSLVSQRRSPRDIFFAQLTTEEIALTEMLRENPYAKNTELAKYLTKSRKTIENQFSSIYRKLQTAFDIQLERNRKRHVLLDVINNRT